MTSAAIYARVSSARQKEQETIVSQTEALRAHAGQLGLDVPEQWVFEDDGYSGASLVRPALDALRDLVAQVPVDVVLCYSPDRLARKYAYQALLMEELARAGTSVVFVKAPSGDTPEDALLVQFQGMIEYLLVRRDVCDQVWALRSSCSARPQRPPGPAVLAVRRSETVMPGPPPGLCWPAGVDRPGLLCRPAGLRGGAAGLGEVAGLCVLTLAGDRISAITGFTRQQRLARFRLPRALPE
jgi:hypothetical protein